VRPQWHRKGPARGLITPETQPRRGFRLLGRGKGCRRLDQAQPVWAAAPNGLIGPTRNVRRRVSRLPRNLSAPRALIHGCSLQNDALASDAYRAAMPGRRGIDTDVGLSCLERARRRDEVASGGLNGFDGYCVGPRLYLRRRTRAQPGETGLLHQSSQHHSGPTRTHPSGVLWVDSGDRSFWPSPAAGCKCRTLTLTQFPQQHSGLSFVVLPGTRGGECGAGD
jgi:hypothetical protein